MNIIATVTAQPLITHCSSDVDNVMAISYFFCNHVCRSGLAVCYRGDSIGSHHLPLVVSKLPFCSLLLLRITLFSVSCRLWCCNWPLSAALGKGTMLLPNFSPANDKPGISDALPCNSLAAVSFRLPPPVASCRYQHLQQSAPPSPPSPTKP